jgi:hypothetical protein
MIAAIAGAMSESARTRQRRRLLVTTCLFGAAAAAVIVAVGSSPRAPPPSTAISCVAHRLDGHVSVLRSGRELPVDDHGVLGQGDHVIAGADARATLDLSTGTHVVLDHGSDFAIAELGAVQRFTLHVGTMHADVTKLRAGQRFIIQTNDTEVEVRGTSFRVSGGLLPCDGSTTRVVVSEGTVVVRSSRGEDRVNAGTIWPPRCGGEPSISAVHSSAPSSPEAERPPPASELDKGARAPANRPHTVKSEPPTETTSSSSPASPAVTTAEATPSPELAEQNRLYGEATAARRRGATQDAVAIYDRFLARYPSSQLAESATVERMRLLAGRDPHQGGLAARDYLTRWPRGFARPEAMEILKRIP